MAVPCPGTQSRLLPAVSLTGSSGGLDEPRRRHSDQEGATDEEQRLSAGEVLDVADQLAHVGLAQVASDASA